MRSASGDGWRAGAHPLQGLAVGPTAFGHGDLGDETKRAERVVVAVVDLLDLHACDVGDAWKRVGPQEFVAARGVHADPTRDGLQDLRRIPCVRDRGLGSMNTAHPSGLDPECPEGGDDL